MICHIVGARPNFVKAAPLYKALEDKGIAQFIIHTGQHTHAQLSDVFFSFGRLPRPDVILSISETEPERHMLEMEEQIGVVFQEHRPEWVVVYGDVTSTLAGTRAAKRNGIPVAHVEAGCRSFDHSMPEEIIRIKTDALADLLFVPGEREKQFLLNENIPSGRIFITGNILADALLQEGFFPRNPMADFSTAPLLLTLHRPSNVDDPNRLGSIFEHLASSIKKFGAVFPVHPRTEKIILLHRISIPEKLQLVPPMDRAIFLKTLQASKMLVTDSGGLQVESSLLNIPCLTIRSNTEHPETLTKGTNVLCGNELENLNAFIENHPRRCGSSFNLPEMDGKSSVRMAEILARSMH